MRLGPLNLAEMQGVFVDGASRAALSGETYVDVDPADGKQLAVVAKGGPEDIHHAVAAAREALEGAWAKVRPADRSRLLLSLAGAIRAVSEDLARLESMDVGKPISQARADVEVAARYFEFYGGVADKLMGSTIPLGAGLLDMTLKEPIGVSGQIIPFNYPIQNTGRGAAPALAAGCTVVLKPSPEAPLSALAIAALAVEVGIPRGALNVVPGFSDAGAALASDPRIDQITFTGSVPTGIAVAQAAAENVVPAVLELGGKSPSIFFADADFEAALSGVRSSMYANAGQTCSAGTRLLVENSPEGKDFVEQLAASVGRLTLGRGLDDPDVGPLVSSRQLERVESYLELARSEHATFLVGGSRPEDPDLRGGYFVEPTVLADVDPDSRLAQEEIFGPVLTVFMFHDVHEAAVMANDTSYGLSASVWTRDIDKALDLAAKIKSGQVYVNPYAVGGGVELPFGGYKRSGWGREKGLEALHEYMQVKNVCIGYRVS